jgi:uncharacterized zinc-type alcohol dehydrogenase-like protein
MSEDAHREQGSHRHQASHSRRDMLLGSALTLGGVAAASGVLRPSRAGASAQGSAIPANAPIPTEGMAAYAASGPHKLLKFQRRALGPKDVAIKIRYSGICHSDIHTVRGDWGKVQYPLITGHEMAGEVIAVGSSAGKFRVGSRVGVGTMVDSCRRCAECKQGFEQFCENGNTQAYGSKDRDGSITQGGYSRAVVVNEDFVLAIPDVIELADAGPLLCAGITVYSPLRHWRVGSGKRVAIIGMGGLGHLAVQLATAMGAAVTVITTSLDKAADARRFGAKEVIFNKEGADLTKHRKSFDFALDTVPYQHDLGRFVPLLERDATYCRVGVGKLTTPNPFGQMDLVLARNSIAGSNTGGIRETREMLDFCAAHDIRPQTTKVALSAIDDAWSKVIGKKARYRFVIDMGA